MWYDYLLELEYWDIYRWLEKFRVFKELKYVNKWGKKVRVVMD